VIGIIKVWNPEPSEGSRIFSRIAREEVNSKRFLDFARNDKRHFKNETPAHSDLHLPITV
jgi:hypothetical protein